MGGPEPRGEEEAGEAPCEPTELRGEHDSAGECTLDMRGDTTDRVATTPDTSKSLWPLGNSRIPLGSSPPWSLLSLSSDSGESGRGPMRPSAICWPYWRMRRSKATCVGTTRTTRVCGARPAVYGCGREVGGEGKRAARAPETGLDNTPRKRNSDPQRAMNENYAISAASPAKCRRPRACLRIFLTEQRQAQTHEAQDGMQLRRHHCERLRLQGR